jgi:O-antigen ligase
MVAVYLCLCVFAGGATRPGLPVESLLQLLALPLLLWGTWRLADGRVAKAGRMALVWFLLVIGWILLQLLPLPVGVWTALGGRAELREELELAGAVIAARPISLDIDATLRAALSLLVPLALGLMTLSLHQRERVRLLQLILLLALGSAVLGLAQIAGGRESPLRWHLVTNPEDAVGPFANRNHLASLLVLALPLAAAQMINAGGRIVAGEQRPRRTAALVIGIIAAVLLMLSLAMVRSRAGVLLAAIAAIGCGAMLWRRETDDDERARPGAKRWLAMAGIIGLLCAIQFGFFGLLQRFGQDPLDDWRWSISRTTLAAADHFGTLGVGAGGFVAAYESVQPGAERVSVYINRAHNDWAEWWLEGGVPLALLLLLGLVLLLWRSVAAWRHGGEAAIWRRAAIVGIWLVLLHSLSDYPLRTTALAGVLAVLFAHACAQPRGSDHADAERVAAAPAP